MHSGTEFGEAEQRLKRKREEDVVRLVHETGGSQETVYRDKHGRKLDMMSEMMHQQSVKEGKAQALKEAQYEWGKGAVQKQQKEERDREFNELKNEPFARTIDDPKLERSRREATRDGDPMAAYFEKKREKRRVTDDDESDYPQQSSTSKKPIYRGPNPTPNRFGIRPGYRWDAIDRSNSFEKKVLLKINEKSSFNEEEYKWRVSDL
jgi:pre-mRNA-splicing factor CWC26